MPPTRRSAKDGTTASTSPGPGPGRRQEPAEQLQISPSKTTEGRYYKYIRRNRVKIHHSVKPKDIVKVGKEVLLLQRWTSGMLDDYFAITGRSYIEQLSHWTDRDCLDEAKIDYGVNVPTDQATTSKDRSNDGDDDAPFSPSDPSRVKTKGELKGELKVVSSLLGSSSRGHWISTPDNLLELEADIELSAIPQMDTSGSVDGEQASCSDRVTIQQQQELEDEEHEEQMKAGPKNRKRKRARKFGGSKKKGARKSPSKVLAITPEKPAEKTFVPKELTSAAPCVRTDYFTESDLFRDETFGARLIGKDKTDYLFKKYCSQKELTLSLLEIDIQDYVQNKWKYIQPESGNFISISTPVNNMLPVSFSDSEGETEDQQRTVDTIIGLTMGLNPSNACSTDVDKCLATLNMNISDDTISDKDTSQKSTQNLQTSQDVPEDGSGDDTEVESGGEDEEQNEETEEDEEAPVEAIIASKTPKKLRNRINIRRSSRSRKLVAKVYRESSTEDENEERGKEEEKEEEAKGDVEPPEVFDSKSVESSKEQLDCGELTDLEGCVTEANKSTQVEASDVFEYENNNEASDDEETDIDDYDNDEPLGDSFMPVNEGSDCREDGQVLLTPMQDSVDLMVEKSEAEAAMVDHLLDLDVSPSKVASSSSMAVNDIISEHLDSLKSFCGVSETPAAIVQKVQVTTQVPKPISTPTSHPPVVISPLDSQASYQHCSASVPTEQALNYMHHHHPAHAWPTKFPISQSQRTVTTPNPPLTQHPAPVALVTPNPVLATEQQNRHPHSSASHRRTSVARPSSNPPIMTTGAIDTISYNSRQLAHQQNPSAPNDGNNVSVSSLPQNLSKRFVAVAQQHSPKFCADANYSSGAESNQLVQAYQAPQIAMHNFGLPPYHGNAPFGLYNINPGPQVPAASSYIHHQSQANSTLHVIQNRVSVQAQQTFVNYPTHHQQGNHHMFINQPLNLIPHNMQAPLMNSQPAAVIQQQPQIWQTQRTATTAVIPDYQAYTGGGGDTFQDPNDCNYSGHYLNQ